MPIDSLSLTYWRRPSRKEYDRARRNLRRLRILRNVALSLQVEIKCRALHKWHAIQTSVSGSQLLDSLQPKMPEVVGFLFHYTFKSHECESPNFDFDILSWPVLLELVYGSCIVLQPLRMYTTERKRSETEQLSQSRMV